MKTDKFEPAWKSLDQYEIPEWFRNAKFVVMECPENNEEILIKSLAAGSRYFHKNINNVEILGGKIISYKFDTDGLHVQISGIKNIKAPIVLKVY